MDKYRYGSSSVSEIQELEDDDDKLAHHQDPHHRHQDGEEEDCVYVGVGKGDTSMDALSWTLNNLVTLSTTVYLIHVFPEIKHVPNPLGVGMIPKSQVSAEQVESHMAQERAKRWDLLRRFLQSCSSSKVKVDTILIESDLIAQTILDLVPILQIRNLVIGANKLYIRKSRSRKGNGIADQIQQNAPQSCKVRIICEGKEVNDEQMMPPSPRPPPHASADDDTSKSKKEEHHQNDSVSCICFKPKFR